MKIRYITVALLCSAMLCSCGNDTSAMYSIKSGGETVDLTDNEQAAVLTQKLQGVLSAAGTIDNIGVHAEVEKLDFSLTQESVSNYDVGTIPEEEKIVHEVSTADLKVKGSGKLDVVVNGLQSATQFSELGAYVGLNDVNLDFKLDESEIESGYSNKEDILAVDIGFKDASAEAWLKESKVYADLSSKGFLDAGDQILSKLIGYEISEEQNIFQLMIEESLGSLKPFVTLDTTNDPIKYPLIGAEVGTALESIDLTSLTSLISAYGVFASNILTIKIYNDGGVGLFVDLTKEKIVNVAKNILVLTLGDDAKTLTDEQITAMLPEFINYIVKCDVQIALVINGNGSLNRIGADVDVVLDIDKIKDNTNNPMLIDGYRNTDVSILFKGYVRMNYNEKIKYPNLSKFTDSETSLPIFGSDDEGEGQGE